MKNESCKAICIIGMHRSGTSMVARLLNRCGLYLGPEERLLGESESNLLGHFEHQGFIEIDDALLAHFGGSAFAPPKLTTGWERDPSLAQYVEKAKILLQTFENRSLWGWKEPRTSLLLPFWKTLIPNLRFVVCVRNPMEVASSLVTRGNGSFEKGIWLWNEYTQAALRDTENHPRIIIFYEDFFRKPNREILKLANFCGLPGTGDSIETDIGVSAELRHYEFRIEDLLLDQRIFLEQKLLYVGLRVLDFEASRRKRRAADADDIANKGIASLLALLTAYRDDSQVSELQASLALKDQTIENLTADARCLASQREVLASEIRAVRSTLFWKFFALMESLKNVLFPSQTRKRAMYDRFLNKLKSSLGGT
jgi:hypothetical protein